MPDLAGADLKAGGALISADGRARRQADAEAIYSLTRYSQADRDADPHYVMASRSQQLMSGNGRSGNQVLTNPQSSASGANYDMISNVAGGTGAVLDAVDYLGTAKGKYSAISILDRAAPLHRARIEAIAKSGELSDAMKVVSSNSKSGQAMVGVAKMTKALGPLGFAASVSEISADVAAAPANQKVETFASSTTSAAVGGVAVAGAAKAGAAIGFLVAGPPGAVVGGLLCGGGAALAYEFGGGSNAVKGVVKNQLLDINGKKR